ncbi:MAG: hypothetical protein JSV62_12125 [Promethearchaeota archaeon]|nr:MAG: hypothetical protein JSV62_12125 [Candidatus Lokiarchaeota archaeon]
MIDKETDNNNPANASIFIKKEAFRNMITHVLRFGSNALENSIEVLGVCIGKYNVAENKVIIENAIPITHGDKVEIGFDKDMYELFEQIRKKYSLNLLGYYHSHPSWGLYLSESDLGNLQYFQNEESPYCFSIVFDHTLMGQGMNLGFDIFRLDDYSKTDKYSSIPFELEIPSTLEYFKWVQKFLEDFQKKNPILIKEINEIDEQIPGELQEIPSPEEPELLKEEYLDYSQITSLFSGFKQGSQKLSEMFVETFKAQIGDWFNDISRGNSQGTEYISKSVNKMKETVSSGFLKVNNWFKKTLNEIVVKFKKDVIRYVDTRIEEQKQFAEGFTQVKETIIKNLNEVVEENIKNLNNEIDQLVATSNEKLEDNSRNNIKIEELVNHIVSNLTSSTDRINSITLDFKDHIIETITPLNSSIDEKFEKLNAELQVFKNNSSEIRSLLERLQKIITNFRNITKI